MLTCPALHCPLPTRNRTFSSADALLDHARQTKAFHPLCTICLRVFKDAAALDQHAEAKHVVVCQPCNRKYKSQSALDQHWRASSAHPNCPVCDAGAADTSALAMHIANAHPKVRCCGTLLNESDLDMHYLTSRNHPVCSRCNVGFPTGQEYAEHNSELHSELQCRICAQQFPTAEALKAHAGDSSSHRRCEFCSAQFKDTSALVEHFTETHIQIQESVDSTMDVTSTTRSPSPMNQSHVHPSRGPSSTVIGAERFSAIRPEPSSRASTSVSDIASELSHFTPSMGTYTPSPPNLSASSSNIFHSQDASRLPERPTSQLPNTTFPYVSGAVGSPSLVARTSSAVQTPPLVSSAPVSPPPPIPPRVTGPVTPAPAHRGGLHAHSRSQSQTHSHSQLQSHHLGVGLQAPPSSARSKVSVAETPSGDLANFHLLKGSPLQSVADFDTPTPSPRTPSVSPADAQAYALALANGGGGYLPPLAADHRRFLPGSSVSPSVSRAQRAAAGHRSSFYCRICQADPCHDITATACGHVFCNVCIVEEVRENARCPVCNAAVLLFALLKLDLS